MVSGGSDGGDRTRYFAAFLVGLIATGIAFATLVYSFQLGNLSGYNEAQSYGYAEKYPESTAKSIDICFGNPELSHRQECIEQAIASGRESQRAEYDLNAQRDMAEWAFWLLVITGVGLVVTIVGTAALFWTLYYTREAVKDTGIATKAMVRQTELTEAAQRPWLTISAITPEHMHNCWGHPYNAEPFHAKESIRWKAEWLNTGSSPANNINFFDKIILVPHKTEASSWDITEETIYPSRAAGPTQKLASNTDMLTEQQFEDFCSGKSDVLWYLAARYSDTPSGEPIFQSKVCFRISNQTTDHKGFEGANHMVVTPTGEGMGYR